MREKIIFLVGPTAVGKTATAVCLAQKINAEIISCDSMQVYKNMDIVSSAPSPLLRKKIPHHLIGYVSPRKEYDVVRYRRDAVRQMKKIAKKGKIPLFVGGTGHYMSVLIDGIFEGGAASVRIRSRLYKQAEKYGSAYLHRKLQRVDAEAAVKIHPNDTKRIVRALEVFETAGKPISELQKQRSGFWGKYDISIFCLDMERDKLYKKLETRLEQMFEKGLVAEVRKLLKAGLSKTASYAIGIKELQEYFDGVIDLEEAKRLIKRNTRRYVKRQLTWFRKDKRIVWIKLNQKETPFSAVERISRIWNGHCLSR